MATLEATSPGTGIGSEFGSVRLDAVGVRQGTELSSLGRDCLHAWEPFLAPLRSESFALLEIGAGRGASLRTWREWFPAATLVGLDARRIHLDPAIPGCTILQGDQADPATLHRLLRGHRFRVVVDDGSRRGGDQIQTFLTLFPWLEPAAVYVCAGLSGDAREGDAPERPAAAWFAELGRLLVTRGAGGQGDEPAELTPILRRASGVCLMRGSAIVTG